MVGILPVLSNLEKLLDGEILQADGTILLACLLFLLAWAFFAGGILDRYAHPDELPTRARFFSQNEEYFFRFVRLLIISLLFYWRIFRWVANPLHDWLEDATRDVTQEKTVILFTLLVWLYSLVAPGPGQSGATTILLAFLVGQIYLIARLGLKLWFLAGQTALFQSAERRG